MSAIKTRMFFYDEAPPPGPRWDDVVVYLDEQKVDPQAGETTFAVGALMVPTPVPEATVDDALGPQKQRPFHASKDREPARRRLAASVRKHVPCAEFWASRYLPTRAAAPPNGPMANELQMHVATLVLGRASNAARRSLKVIYAKEPSVNDARFSEWMREQEDVRFGLLLRWGYPMRFPPLELIPAEPKHLAGLQVVDLMLWVQQKRRAERDDEGLFDKMGLLDAMNWTQALGPQEAWGYRIGSGVPVHPVRGLGAAVESLTAQRAADLLLGIERCVHTLAGAAPAPDVIAHLMPRVKAASDATRGTLTADTEARQSLLGAFLLVADTLPVYSPEAPRSMVDAADAIALARYLFVPRSASGWISMLDHWGSVRRANVAQLAWD